MESRSWTFYSTEEVLKFFTMDSQSDDESIQSCDNLSSDDSDSNNESTKGNLYISDSGRENLSNEEKKQMQSNTLQMNRHKFKRWGKTNKKWSKVFMTLCIFV